MGYMCGITFECMSITCGSPRTIYILFLFENVKTWLKALGPAGRYEHRMLHSHGPCKGELLIQNSGSQWICAREPLIIVIIWYTSTTYWKMHASPSDADGKWMYLGTQIKREAAISWIDTKSMLWTLYKHMQMHIIWWWGKVPLDPEKMV